MKTKLLTLFSLFLLSVGACKKDPEPLLIVAGNYYSDCFSESPMKNRKLRLVYSKYNGGGGIIDETTTDANGFFKFSYEYKNKYQIIKIEQEDPVLGRDNIVENIMKFEDRSKIKMFYQTQGKVVYTTDFKNNYTEMDTLYYTHPSTSGNFTLTGPFINGKSIDSLLFGLEGTGFKMFWGIGYADFRKNFQSSNCHRCIPIENVTCGGRTIIKMTE